MKWLLSCITIASCLCTVQAQDHQVEHFTFVNEVWKEVQAELASENSDRTMTVTIISHRWPEDFAETTMMQLLDDSNAEIKLIACEALLRYDSNVHHGRVMNVIDKLSFSNPLLMCRKAIARLKLELPNSKLDVENFASLQHIKAEWLCPMDPEVSGNGGDICPICQMRLEPKTRHPSDVDREAQMLALDELAARRSPIVPKVCRELVASDTNARWRQYAASIWARMEIENARPHVETFLRSGRFDTLSFIAFNMPDQFADELREIVEDDTKSIDFRVVAARGLAAAGHATYLTFLRQAAQNENLDIAARAMAIDQIGQLGTSDDISILNTNLESEMRFFTAPAAYRLLQKKRGENKSLRGRDDKQKGKKDSDGLEKGQ